MKTREMRIKVGDAGEVSAVLVRPARAQRLLVVAHGAGAGMHHPFMEALAGELAAAGVATCGISSRTWRSGSASRTAPPC